MAKQAKHQLIRRHGVQMVTQEATSYTWALRLAWRDRDVVAILKDSTILWGAPGVDLVVLVDKFHYPNAGWSVGCYRGSSGKPTLQRVEWDSIRDRITYTPQTGWRFTRRCFLCDTGIALKEDEVYGVGGYVLCQSCEAGIKRSRITVNRSDLTRKWNRYLKAIDLLAVSH